MVARDDFPRDYPRLSALAFSESQGKRSGELLDGPYGCRRAREGKNPETVGMDA